jgi:hypothetical protein
MPGASGTDGEAWIHPKLITARNLADNRVPCCSVRARDRAPLSQRVRRASAAIRRPREGVFEWSRRAQHGARGPQVSEVGTWAGEGPCRGTRNRPRLLTAPASAAGTENRGLSPVYPLFSRGNRKPWSVPCLSLQPHGSHRGTERLTATQDSSLRAALPRHGRWSASPMQHSWRTP